MHSKSLDAGRDGATHNGVCAIFTSYHPDHKLLENIASVRSQVERLVIVDNGSGAEMLEQLTTASLGMSFHVISNSQNAGIAAALNQGSLWAMEQGSKFLLYFDQDSTATDGMVSALLDTYSAFDTGRDNPLGMLATTNRERNSGHWQPPLHDAHGSPVILMTSGSLVPSFVYSHCGPFEEDFFIEFVDHEYSLRLRANGFRLAICPTATLIHDVGFPEIHSFFGLFEGRCTHHRAARRYYFARNLTVLLRRYFRREFLWSRVEIVAFFKTMFKISLYESRSMEKLWFSIRGIVDGFRRAMGQRVRL